MRDVAEHATEDSSTERRAEDTAAITVDSYPAPAPLQYGYHAKPRYDNEWVVVGSGPSAQYYKHVCEGRKVATVNAAVGNGGELDVDAYGVFELAAYPVFAEKYERMVEKGVECFTRPAIAKKHEPGGKVVTLQTGYDQRAEGPAGRFCSAGCAMLNAIAAHKKPAAIHMIGFDGYEGDDKETRRKNVAMSRHIGEITRAHRNVRFVLHGGSNLPKQERWRVEREGKI